jgi:hypothetical protein
MAEASLPQQPDGALCIVEPRDLADIAVLTSSPPPERSEADEIEWDDARAATEEEVIGLTQLFLEFFACYNLGDYSRLAALFTDDALSRGFVSEIVYEPPDELKVRFEGVYAGYMFSDGRLGAVLVTSTPAEFAPLQSMFFFLKLVNGRWLIDDVPPSGVTVRVPQ